MASIDQMNLTDRTFIILRKRNFLELTFQEFRSQYATTFNVMNPPERAKLMKLPIIKVSYSQKHKKQTMKVLIEKDYICEHLQSCKDVSCHKLHVLKQSDRCHLFDRDQTCNNPKCTKLHIPCKSLHTRILEVFKKSSRSIMPFSKFIVLHRTTYPELREHHPTNDILTTEEFADIVRIESTEKTKEIRLLRKRRSGDKYSGIERPPSLSENIDAPHPALKIISFDTKWIDTEPLLNDIKALFAMHRIKDIFIPNHVRMAFVTFSSAMNAQSAVKKLNDTWFYGRKVNVALAEHAHRVNDEEKQMTARICIKEINNVISERRIKEWLDRIGKIEKIETCFLPCRKGSDVAYIHFKSMKMIQEILSKEKKTNYVITFRGKQVKLSLCDDGYTDSSAYYSLKQLHAEKNSSNHSLQSPRDKNKDSEHKPNDAKHQNGSHPVPLAEPHNNNHALPAMLSLDDHKKQIVNGHGLGHDHNHRAKPRTSHSDNNLIASSLHSSKSLSERLKLISNHSALHAQQQHDHDINKNDSMQLLVMRLKSLIESTIETQKSLESKLQALSFIDNGLTQNHGQHQKQNADGDEDQKAEQQENGRNHNHHKPDNNNDVDIDVVFGDESYTIDALKESLDNLKNDKNQIQVYKQALTAFETSQSRAINKNQRELKPVVDKEIALGQSLQSVKSEIEMLEKQLALKRNEQEHIEEDLDVTRIKARTLRKTINEMKNQIEPIRDCLAAFDTDTNNHKSKMKQHGVSKPRRASSGAYKQRRKNISIKADQIPTEEAIQNIEKELQVQEQNISHWLKWDSWNLQDATAWIGSLEHGRFKAHLSKFNALSKISQGSILNAITDPTLQIIGIGEEEDRKLILHHIAMLKSRTAMMRKSQEKFRSPSALRNAKSLPFHGRRSSVSASSLLRGSNEKGHANKDKKYGLDDLAVQEMIRSASMQSDASDVNLCVICMDRAIAPYAMVPCGHQCLCQICKNLIKPDKHKCPMCNGSVTMVIKLFRA
mmetsp:Transcript_34021/g.54527  ORF Transcript_34021/g.54527 Transcript_34021/m.54527 type:complete len:1001 (-) Transcript_34021:182-3184(-)